MIIILSSVYFVMLLFVVLVCSKHFKLYKKNRITINFINDLFNIREGEQLSLLSCCSVQLWYSHLE